MSGGMQAAGTRPHGAGDSASPGMLRLDKFLVFARFFRTRARAQAVIAARRVRINSLPVDKAHAIVRPGDVLTFPQGARIRVVRVLRLPQRRGSAPDAATAFEEVPPSGGRGAAGGGGEAPPAGERDEH